MRRTSFNFMLLTGLAGVLGTAVACSDDGGGTDSDSTIPTSTSITTTDATATITDSASDTMMETTTDSDSDATMSASATMTGPLLDQSTSDTDDPSTSGGGGCIDGECNNLDLLFVIDNSGTMGEEQVNLSANFPLLIQRLQELQDAEGNPLNPNVNIMVTTTDLGHPQCTPFQPEGYEPAQGAPQQVACINRLDDFTGLGSSPPSFPEACTNGCPVAVAPADPFIHFEGPNAATTNIPGNNVSGALSCIGPQGINGCGYEAPLEAMLQAVNPGAEWNNGNKPFLRDGAILAVAVITDEADCSVRSPDGYAFFTDQMQNTYWEINPDTGTKTQATSAVCWNAGVNCGAPGPDGVYADCNSIDTGVLHPINRYISYLKNELIDNQNKEVVMLGILGVPEVTAHNPDVPFNPTAGGVMDLVYRQWKDGAYPVGDILPGDDGTAATKEFEFGVGPGCTGEDGMGGFTGQAIPPVRVKEVCESLNEEERLRCCIESICDTDFSDAIGCLSGLIQETIVPIG